MATEKVVGMIKSFLDERIDTEEFSFLFPDVLLAMWDAMEKENPNLTYLLNEEMPEICSYFEPEANARSQRPEYLDETEFRKKVTAVYKNVLELMGN